MTWQTLNRPGYFGRHQEERYIQLRQRFGTDGWRIVRQTGERIGCISEAVMVYEDAFYKYLSEQSDLVCWLVCAALGVYDDAPSNISSGLDYSRQETEHTHLQDIAIRRCLVRMGRIFQGSRLVQIRDIAATQPIHRLSLALSPGRVPFHRPEWIIKPELVGWWDEGSVEGRYQSNKLLQINADRPEA